ncbi:MAG: filamentous hemagglutinin N-terminal domain-containing protein [Spirulina sp.]
MLINRRWHDIDRQVRQSDRQSLRLCGLRLWISLVSCLGAVVTASSATAQISGDGSLGTTVFPLGTNLIINGGTTSGNNLFHSFSEFSVPSGNIAVFHNATTIENIIGRVTGGNISQIEGIISANGTANLFLINPAGITFGSNAIINVGGSFFASTADSILFADGVEFNAGSAAANPLLTVSAPVGLAFKGSQGQIRVEGSGHNRTLLSSVLIPGIPQGVQLYSGGTLALVGNGVSLEGGEVFAPGGRVEVASVQSGNVGLSQVNGRWALTLPDNLNFADIQLRDRALIDASDFVTFGARGDIQLAGRQISLENGSLIVLQNYGSQDASGTITLRASELVDIQEQLSSDEQVLSGLYSQALGAGNGADMNFQTQRLLVRQNSRIISSTYGQGQGGDLTVNASELFEISGNVPNRETLFSQVSVGAIFSSGNAGNTTINTARFRVLDGATLNSNTFLGTGNSGNIEINATESIELIGGIAEIVVPSNISVASLGFGQGGDLTLNTRQLIVQDGGRVDSSTVSSGRAGNIYINASDGVKVSGTIPGLTTPSLISSIGDVPDDLVLQPLGFVLTGDSGDVTIDTHLLEVTDNGSVTVRNEGTGNAGTLQVNANRIELKDGGRLTALTSSGEGGNINLQVSELLLMRREALISAEAGGTGNGGNITINAPFIVAVPGENSDIIANAFQGNGGNIDITAIGIFGLEFRDQLTEFSDITASSQFGVSGTVTISNPNTNPAALSAELQGKVLDPNQQVARGCDAVGDSRFVASGRGGLPENPGDRRSGLNAWQDVRDLSISYQSPVISYQLTDRQPLVEATGWRARADGTVEIYAEANVPPETLATPNCAARTISHSNF